MDIDDILNEARDSLGPYCLTECDNSCCRRGYLITKRHSEVRLLFGAEDTATMEEIEANDFRLEIYEFLTKDYKYKINLTPCPQLDGKKCRIYDNPDRPPVCKEYPIFNPYIKRWQKRSSEINIRTDCPAVKAGKLDSLIRKLEDTGLYDVNLL